LHYVTFDLETHFLDQQCTLSLHHISGHTLRLCISAIDGSKTNSLLLDIEMDSQVSSRFIEPLLHKKFLQRLGEVELPSFAIKDGFVQEIMAGITELE
jgi:hypothetical protein